MSKPDFDTEEFDEAYASYVDARRRFNDLKLSRGFLPVVAPQDSAPSSSTTPSQKPFKGMGKGKTGKNKGKGKSSTFRYDRPPGKQPDPKGRARSALAPAACAVVQPRTRQPSALRRVLHHSRLLRLLANAKQLKAWLC